MIQFDPKRPGESVTLTFEFADALPAGAPVASVASVTMEVLRGVDEAPAALLVGGPALVGTQVLQRVAGGVLGVDYLAVARVILADGQSREFAVALPVRRF